MTIVRMLTRRRSNIIFDSMLLCKICKNVEIAGLIGLLISNCWHARCIGRESHNQQNCHSQNFSTISGKPKPVTEFQADGGRAAPPDGNFGVSSDADRTFQQDSVVSKGRSHGQIKKKNGRVVLPQFFWVLKETCEY
jgi:hypothetical protein